MRQEKESLTQQLLNTIQHKVALSQELDAWQVSVSVVCDTRLAHKRIRPSEPFVSVGGHATGDQSTGAAEGGGAAEGAGARARHTGTAEEQVSEGEGRRRTRVLLFFFQRQTVTEEKKPLHVGRCEQRLTDGRWMFTDFTYLFLCLYIVANSFTFIGLYIKSFNQPASVTLLSEHFNAAQKT